MRAGVVGLESASARLDAELLVDLSQELSEASLDETVRKAAWPKNTNIPVVKVPISIGVRIHHILSHVRDGSQGSQDTHHRRPVALKQPLRAGLAKALLEPQKDSSFL
jgi:hypothetical protein